MQKVKITTVGSVDWSSNHISRVGIIPYIIRQHETWMAFGISNLTSKLITIGGGVEKSDFNLFYALKRELKEEIDVDIDETSISGSIVMIHDDQLLLFWEVTTFNFYHNYDKNELDNIVWITQSQFKSIPKKRYGSSEYLLVSSVIIHFETEIEEIDLISFVADVNELPMNSNKQREICYDEQNIGNYDTFMKNFVGKTWYIVYIYQFKHMFFMKTERSEYYIFYDNEIQSILSLLYKSNTLSVYFPYCKDYKHLSGNYRRPRYLGELISKYLPWVTNSFHKILNAAASKQNEYYNEYIKYSNKSNTFPNSEFMMKITMEHEKQKCVDMIVNEGLYVVDKMSEIETQIYGMHKKNGSIKREFNYNLIGDINYLFLNCESDCLNMNYIIGTLGLKAYYGIIDKSLPYDYDTKTELVSLIKTN